MNTPVLFGAAAFAAISAILLATLCFVAPIQVLQGWSAGFIWLTIVPVGALALLVIHRITGGKWGYELAPVLEPAAKAILPVAVFVVPMLLYSARIYRWSSPEMAPALIQHYMTPVLFALRAIIALVLWSLFAWVVGMRSTVLRSALVLVVLAIVTSVIPVDWLVSATPGFYSSAFGFGFGIEEVLAALALCAVVGPQSEAESDSRDLAGLIIAALLGTIYFGYIQFLVIWYGNLPGKADWYVTRSLWPWPEIGGASLAAGGIFPFVFLLNQHVRSSDALVRLAGAGVLLGVALHTIWMTVPNFGIGALGPAVLTFVLSASLSILWLHWRGVRWHRRIDHPSGVVAGNG